IEAEVCESFDPPLLANECCPTDSMSTAAAFPLTMADGHGVAARAHRVVGAPQAVGITPR
ncbi:MAG: hypothetical protein M0Z33_02870, partial [Actinomycetota bacterium]|nr:hypothetical protein [Actinomycetota bacterium]